MTKLEFLAECRQNIVFEEDKVYAVAEDSPVCPFCGKEMVWNTAYLTCSCEGQTSYIKKYNDIKEQINNLQNSLEELKDSAVEKTLSFFSKYYLKNINDLRKSLDERELDLKKFVD